MVKVHKCDLHADSKYIAIWYYKYTNESPTHINLMQIR